MLETPLSPIASPLTPGILAPDFDQSRSLEEDLLPSDIPFGLNQHSHGLLGGVRSFPCPTYVNRDNLTLFKQLRRKYKRKVHKLIKKRFQNTCEVQGILDLKMCHNSNGLVSIPPSTPLKKDKGLHEVLRRLNLAETTEMI